MDDTTRANGYKHGRPEGRDVKPADEIVRKVIEALPAETRLYPDVYAWQVTDALEAATSAPAVDREALIRVLSDPQWKRGNDVREWPEDEAEAYREEGWSEGIEAASAVLVEKQVDALIAALGARDVRDVQAEALEQAADAVRAFGGLGSEASGHTSTHSVRKWLHARAQAIREARSER